MNNTLVNNARGHTTELFDDVWRAIGWTWAEACNFLDRGIDPRQVEVPVVMDHAKRDLSDIQRMKTTQIITKLQVEGVHNWPDCPIEEVAYLKHPHRHIFHIEARKMVTHADRDIEIIQFGHTIRQYLNDCFQCETQNLLDFGSQSCEMIANDLLQTFALDSCQVLEDGENGAIITV